MSPSPASTMVPQTIQLLSSFLEEDNITSYFSQDEDEKPVVRKSIPKLLDALVFLLRTTPRDGKVFAMTLGIDSKEVIITLAANKAEDLSGEDALSPQTLLVTIWNYLVEFSKMSTPPVLETYLYMTHLLNIHSPLLRHRFQKWRDACKRLCDSIEEDKAGPTLGEGVEEYLKAVNTICTATEALLASGVPFSEQSVRLYGVEISRFVNN
ncbi:hypothetical protein QCA50_014681 [Cerrena zonata]|uniref:Uncharacterized protein n=1 Tax=Cerrena zonata TaxID=2478898 RepID=A0AAW0FKZ0_9APHY